MIKSYATDCDLKDVQYLLMEVSGSLEDISMVDTPRSEPLNQSSSEKQIHRGEKTEMAVEEPTTPQPPQGKALSFLEQYVRTVLSHLIQTSAVVDGNGDATQTSGWDSAPELDEESSPGRDMRMRRPSHALFAHRKRRAGSQPAVQWTMGLSPDINRGSRVGGSCMS